MSYEKVEKQLKSDDIIILDGGTGTELERRGVVMNPQAWCGPATLENAALLEDIHCDYISAGADIITANTFASSRLMLSAAGFGDQFEEINRIAVKSALRARETSGRPDILVAGCLSHMCPYVGGAAKSDTGHTITQAEMTDAFGELAMFLRDEGCDLILLEMMYYPERMDCAFEAALQTGLPVWAGFSARRSKNGQIISHAPEDDIPFEEVVSVLNRFDVAAAGIMHTPSDMISDSLTILREVYDGPLTAYPDSGYFKMPNWQFEKVIQPTEFLQFVTQWVADGVQVIGGCCGLSPEHIAALKPLKQHR
jgi:S-methylmethionine-dependent homocysteine/selenocysteine methylase